MVEFLKARWENLAMINYAMDPDVLKPLLPNGVELDYFEGKTYVSLVGFNFNKIRVLGVPLPMRPLEGVTLRFYVKREVGNEVRRGVVHISEIIPSKMVALSANLLYRQRYKVRRATHQHIFNPADKKVVYKWRINKKWNRICVQAMSDAICMKDNSMEEFIFDHYYGYTKLNGKRSLEYKVDHPRWMINYVKDFDLHCCFQNLFGDSFKILDKISPHSIMLAEGSDVSLKWKRNYF
jgi:uncharacterized protein YqjF (DUF2071 family)